MKDYARDYLFTSARIGFRTWLDDDLDGLAAINDDAEVMQHFPRRLTRDETGQFIARMRQMFATRGHCYYAAEELASGQLLGFLGLSVQEFASDFTPAVDIGWRLARHAWGCGYASEGARRCLQYAAGLGLPEVIAVAPCANELSIRVMQRIGMRLRRTFEHPLLLDDARLRRCVLYGIELAGGVQDTSGPP